MSDAGEFLNPEGKVYEMEGADPFLALGVGVVGFVVTAAMLLFFIFSHQQISEEFTEFGYNFYVISMIGIFAISLWIFRQGWNDCDKNTQYIINAKRNLFFVPLSDEPLCCLSDIEDINIRTESERVRESYSENQKTKYRTVTRYTHYISLVGHSVDYDTGFRSKGERDQLHSYLKLGIGSVKDFLKKNG